MSKYKLIPFAFVVLFACDDTTPELLLAPDQVVEKKAEDGHAFETDVAMTNFMILPAAALGVSTTDFGGRCSGPAVWISVFRIEGQIPHVGDVWGSASHCAYKDDPADPTELPTYEDGRGGYARPMGTMSIWSMGMARPSRSRADSWRSVMNGDSPAAPAGSRTSPDRGSITECTTRPISWTRTRKPDSRTAWAGRSTTTRRTEGDQPTSAPRSASP